MKVLSIGKRSKVAGLAVCRILLAVPAVVFPLPYSLLPLVLILAALAAVWILRKPVRLLVVVIILSPLVSSVRRLQTLSIDGVSFTFSGLLWMAVATFGLILPMLSGVRLRIPRFVLPFLAFTLWTAWRFLFSSAGPTGLKDIFFYGLPCILSVFLLFLADTAAEDLQHTLEKWLPFSALLPLAIYALSLPFGWVRLTPLGPKGIVDDRCTAYYLLMVLSLSLALWRYGADRTARRRGTFASLLSMALILFTLSRMASFVAIFLAGLALLTPPRIGRILAAGTAMAILLALLLLASPPQIGESASTPVVNLFSLQSSGRNQFWSVTFSHALDSPVIGWGPGSARILVAHAITNRVVEEYYPHNEYLQVFHDLGLIGLVLLLAAWIPLVYSLWRGWLGAHERRLRREAQWNAAAFFSAVAILLTAVTTNTFHYPFLMGPAFLLIAAARSKTPAESLSL
jgi:O-antigen ligase